MTDKKKLELCIETLEQYLQLSLDSRNYGIITENVKDTLKKVK